MAQRALIIGLGSTGYDVCKHLVDRVQWECGGLERTPWLEVFCLETEPPAGDGPLDRNRIHIKIEPQDYTNLLNNATSAKTIGLERWGHPESLVPLGDKGVTKGAGNIRMIGRIAFMYPNNLDQIYSGIKARLERLSPTNLTPEKARLARGPLPDGTNPEIPLSDTITVYVVGTLCGGTCSGSFIDLGYLLHYEFQRNKHNIQRVGMFALPHLAYTPKDWERRRANAWAGLTELNHFMAGHDYSTQYHFYPGTKIDIPSISPYDVTYLVQPRGGDLNSFETLKLTTSQFLHTDIFNPGASQIGARLIDGAASMTDGDANGSPQTYYSFGLSAVEIPGYLIAQGCCYKLGVEALEDYLAPRPNAPAESDAFRINTLGISDEKVGEKLLRGPTGEEGESQPSVQQRIKEEIKAALDNARNAGRGAASELSQVERRIDDAFAPVTNDQSVSSDSARTSKLPPHFVPRRVKANSSHLIADYESILSRETQLALLDPSRGPQWCQVILDDVEKWLVGRLEELQSGKASDNLEKTLKSAKNELSTARSKIEACATDPFLALFGGTKAAVDRHLLEYEELANRAFQRRLEGSLVSAETELWSKILPQVRAIKVRIMGTGADEGNLVHRAKMLKESLQTRFDGLNNTMPALNGKPIFTPRKTLDEVYERTWNATGKEEKANAKRSFLLGWEDLPRVDSQTGKLRDETGYFAFTAEPLAGDRLRAHMGTIGEKLAQLARQANYFSGATQESILRHLTPPDTALLRETYEKGDVMLNINWNSVSKNVGGKHANIAFFPGATGVTNKPGTTESELWEAIQRTRTGGDTLQAEENADPQSLLFLRAAGGFSLATIEGFQEANFEQTNFRYSFEEVSKGNTTLWSRHDINDWHPFYGDKDPQSDWRKGLFLSALALSKSGDPNDTLIRRAGAGYYYKPQQKLSPTRDRIEFPSDLRSIAHVLRKETEGQKRLLSDITEARHNRPLEELVASLEMLYNNIEQLGLINSTLSFTHKTIDSKSEAPGAPGAHAQNGTVSVGSSNDKQWLDPAQAHDLIIEFWKVADVEMIGRLREPFISGKLSPHVQFRERDQRHVMAGFYCEHTSCKHYFLASDEAHIPDFCPNCNQPCK
jgi:hypothetical protein